MNRRKAFGKVACSAAMMALVLAFSACGGGSSTGGGSEGGTSTPPPASTTEAPSTNDQASSDNSGGEVVFVVMSDAPTLDIHLPGGNNAATSDLNINIMEALVRFTTDDSPTIEPLLATHWDISDDGLVYTFQLRQGVEFHDGTPFNAAAAAKSLNRTLDPSSPANFILNMVESIEAVDEYTLELTLQFPFAPIINHLAHPAGFIAAPSAIDNGTAGTHMIGTGPFMIGERVIGDYTRLVPNPNHWDSVPEVDVVFRVVPDAATRMQMLEAGEAHITYLMPSHYVTMKTRPNVEILYKELSTTSHIEFVTLPERDGQPRPMADVNVRRALAMLIDRDAIFHGVFEGVGVQGVGPLAPLVAHSVSDIPQYPYDPEAAIALLAEAGYADGFHLLIGINEGNTARAQQAELMQAAFLQAGITSDILVREWGAFLEDSNAGIFDITVRGWVTVTADPDYALDPLFHSRNHGDPGNTSFYSNPRVDELLEAGRIEVDYDARDAIYREAIGIILDEVPAIFTIHNLATFGVNGIDGMAITFNQDAVFKDVTLR